jgi:hypothetical protein
MSQISRLRDAEISNGNLINADDIDVELNQLVAESNSQDSRLSTVESSALTFNGIKTFSSAPKTDQIDERSLDAGIIIDGVLHKDGAIRVPGTAGYMPAVNGDFGYDPTSHQYRGMVNGKVRTLAAGSVVTAKTTAFTADLTDCETLFSCTGTFTVSLAAAATLGNGWLCRFRNDGIGIITVDPNGAETINNTPTLVLRPGDSATIICDGTQFKTIGFNSSGLTLLSVITASAAAAVNITSGLDASFDEYELHFNSLTVNNDAIALWLRVSQDGGASFKSGAGNYYYGVLYFNTATGTSGSAADIKIEVFRSIGNATGKSASGVIRIFSPASNTLHKLFQTDAVVRTAGAQERAMGHGAYIADTNPINALQLLPSGGTSPAVSGNFLLYGVRKF